MATGMLSVFIAGSDSDTDDGDVSELDLHNTIFRSYIEASGNQTPDLSKSQSFLITSQSGAFSCLICLERIRPSDPTWSCSSSCYAIFHLICIQAWAHQASLSASERSSARLNRTHFPNAPESSDWHCPKCRFEYKKSDIPRSYFCFCGKSENPDPNPWILPHSCGEVCNQTLSRGCGHRCLVLCHPGPCPPCPKLVKHSCFCGAREELRRCNAKNFSCRGVCSRVLECGLHLCPQVCHDGPCYPCRERGLHRCQCGKMEEKRDCFERDYQCEFPCEKMLPCGKHTCDKGCHAGPCGDCPFQGDKYCPCGNVKYKGLACDAAVPTCGSTCGKRLVCGRHRCPERCHRGGCVQICRMVVVKSCRCGGLKKEVPCHQELVCERKCQRLRDCGRHACRRRCCEGDCPSCPEVCGRKLRCGNHKCPSPCHRGMCAPCPLTVAISCACGKSRIEVPCGTELRQKPPKCLQLCKITPLCSHKLKSKPHRCHYGACPPCVFVCNEVLPCGHMCKMRCHGPSPPPNVEFALRPKKMKPNKLPACKSGSPCPPCQEVVVRPCVGRHAGAERLMCCSDDSIFCCASSCGRMISCGNHYCTKPCHSPVSNELGRAGESCDICELGCQKERKPGCSHACSLPCHPGECPPCKVLIRRSCHCGSLVKVFECTYFNNLQEEEKNCIRSCGGLCHRKLQNCLHLCPEICHPGPCPSPEKCHRKVTVRCACRTMKKEWKCQEVQSSYLRIGSDPISIIKSQFGVGILPCNSECLDRAEALKAEPHPHQPEVHKDILANIPSTFRRRKRRERVQETSVETSRMQVLSAFLWKYMLLISIGIGLSIILYYGYKGLFWLSDWMNEIERRQLQRRSYRF